MAEKSLSELLGGVTRFGRLSIIAEAEPRVYGTRRHRRVHVLCDCGVSKEVAVLELKKGQSQSCGCFKIDKAREQGAATRKHGESVRADYSTEYRIWIGMKSRCYNPKHVGYKNYGARGIAVCDEWVSSYPAFLADMGRRPSLDHTLDRIDNDSGYSPGNCRWATASEQRRNQRSRKAA